MECPSMFQTEFDCVILTILMLRSKPYLEDFPLLVQYAILYSFSFQASSFLKRFTCVVPDVRQKRILSSL
ncbi:hypothetical protein SUGI_1011620 [Cryptomeria japonica]|nr:hypothetical protein SUGI_1011620 [Cryptomeria japonica]